MKTIINAISTSIQAFVNDEEGSATIEYVLIAALVGVATIVSFQAVATELNNILTDIETTLTGAGL